MIVKKLLAPALACAAIAGLAAPSAVLAVGSRSGPG